MRTFLIFISLLIAQVSLHAQKDLNSELEISGSIRGFAVSPSEKLWLVSAAGEAVRCDHLGDNWHYVRPFCEMKKDYSLFDNNLDNVTFFNEDTALITGYISQTKEALSKKNGYYRTTDGGKTWSSMDFGGSSWIYDIFVDPHGHAWMGGSSEDMYYSEDYGVTWKTIPRPFGKNRIMSIYMEDGTNGITASNHLYVTQDNWRSSQTIPSPSDQKKYTNDPKDYRLDNRLNKIVV